jgi:hypothetical protein
MALFAIVLGLLRLTYDRLLGSNVVLGTWSDRIGGGVFGLLTGMLLAGVLTISIQLLPFPESILTYRPYDEFLERKHRLYPFCPDEFTLGLMGHLSDGSLSGRAPFGKVHDNLLQDAFCFRNTAGKNGGRVSKPGVLDDLTFYSVLPEGIDSEDVPRYPHVERGPQRPIVARVTLTKDVADEDGWYRIPGTQVRLVAFDEEQKAHEYYPVGFLTGRMRDHDDGEAWVPSEGWKFHPADVEDGKPKIAMLAVERKLWKGEETFTIDWVYSVREGQKPNNVTFRGTSMYFTTSVEPFSPPAEGALTRAGEKPRN